MTILSVTYSFDSDKILCVMHSFNIKKTFDDRNIGLWSFCKLTKVFDSADYYILLAILNHYRIRGVSNDWFNSYLSNCNQCISLNGYESGLCAINCVVPQGSGLGPPLFL